MENFSVDFSFGAILTGVFTFLLAGMIFSGRRWVYKTEIKLERHEERLARHSDKLIILEEESKYRHKQMNAITGQLLEVNKKLDSLLSR